MNHKLYRIKPRKLATWRAWGRALETKYLYEARFTLKQEQTEAEFFINFKIGKSWYTLGGQIGDSIPAAPGKLNALHKAKIRECLLPLTIGETAYLLKQ